MPLALTVNLPSYNFGAQIRKCGFYSRVDYGSTPSASAILTMKGYTHAERAGHECILVVCVLHVVEQGLLLVPPNTTIRGQISERFT